MMGGNEEEGAGLFSLVPAGSTSGSDHKLKHMKFHVNTGKHFFTVKVVRQVVLKGCGISICGYSKPN